MTRLIDHQARALALDPAQSFIVQAPAGSGKTELLVQRFLVLLAHVETHPEEIIAITFTRKAAAEMRERILSALQAALQPCPLQAHAKTTWHLAQAALQRDQSSGWNLLDNPHRLRIQTIDALCASLARQAPLLSGLGIIGDRVDNNVERYYLTAVRHLLAELEQSSTAANLLVRLLHYLDNRVDRIETLLVSMLARRDQWLPHLIPHQQEVNLLQSRQVLESGLQHIVADIVQNCQQQQPAILTEELKRLWQISQFYLGEKINVNPKTLEEKCQFWQSLAKLLLTEKNQWRVQVNKRQGFPAEEKEHKQQMHMLLKQLQKFSAWRESLRDVLDAPPLKYTEAQWHIIEALITLLPLAVAHLKIIFTEHNTCDFNEVALAASQALGNRDAPSDLAFSLHQQIHHLLIDEFQDTSVAQFTLLEKMIGGWQMYEGRTLFLVGDPMQSIYRFRQAEVGLFLKAQQEGVADICLTPLLLQANFRSTAALVEWTNTQFQHIFPSNVDISSGAVRFSSSHATDNKAGNGQVYIHPLAITQSTENHLLSVITTIQQERPQQTIAVLVRSRSHLQAIIPSLKSGNINFSALEIEPLIQQSVVQDLLALSGALLHLSDRVCWLAVLRAPWCGLTLHDLHVLAHVDFTRPLWERIQQFHTLSTLSDDGKLRLEQIVPVLAYSLSQRGRLNLRNWIESTWHALHGPFCLTSLAQRKSCEAFFEQLEALDHSDLAPSYELLKNTLARQYVNTLSTTKNPVQVMTIHKAKGLEFDNVIIPHLEMKTRSEQEKLLLWLDRPRKGGSSDLVLAPIKASHLQSDPIYAYLANLEKIKVQNETKRLLYVAVTRAKNNLYLLAQVAADKKPSADSFLAYLEPLFSTAILKADIKPVSVSVPDAQWQHDTRLYRLPLVALPSEAKTISVSTAQVIPNLIDDTPRRIGTVIHQILWQISQRPLNDWTIEALQLQQTYWRNLLQQNGVASEYLSIITTAIQRTLNDPRGRWILDVHQEAYSEHALNIKNEAQLSQQIIDRTFIENQTRWIIDYKIGVFPPEKTPPSLDLVRKLHQAQLEKYASSMRQCESYPIKLAVYFPLWSGWYAWDWLEKK